jgi:hypothetical protein
VADPSANPSAIPSAGDPESNLAPTWRVDSEPGEPSRLSLSDGTLSRLEPEAGALRPLARALIDLALSSIAEERGGRRR